MYLRKVIKIRAEDSPNVAFALMQQREGAAPTGEVILPGVLDWWEYKKRRLTWDKVRQCVSLDGEFYEGAETLMYPPTWLNVCEQLAATQNLSRRGKAMGVDPAEGGDSTSFAVVDDQGLIYLESAKTPNTTVITARTIALIRQFDINPKQVMFDRGGGGKEHADRLRYQGYPVSMVGFGESVSPEPVRHMKTFNRRLEERSDKFVYKNRRAQMYHALRLKMEPDKDDQGNIINPKFGIPAEYTELRQQMAPVPLLYDDEGRIYMLPKHTESDTKESLVDRIGRSPDDLDALVLGVYALDPHAGRVKLKAVSF